MNYELDHLEMDEANHERGINNNTRLTALKDYTGKTATAKINGIGNTEPYPLGKGGRTPDEWKRLIKKGLTKLVAK